MGGAERFAPPAETWASHIVLLVARVVPGGAKGQPIQPVSVDRADGSLEVDYRFTLLPESSYTVKAYMALEVPKPAPASVVFKENGQASAPAAGRRRVALAASGSAMTAL